MAKFHEGDSWHDGLLYLWPGSLLGTFLGGKADNQLPPFRPPERSENEVFFSDLLTVGRTKFVTGLNSNTVGGLNITSHPPSTYAALRGAASHAPLQ